MGKFTVIPVLSALLIGMEVQAVEWHEIELTILGIEFERGGELNIYLFLEPGFPTKHEEAVKRYKVDAQQTVQVVAIETPDESFALKVHHDEDRSGSVNKNWTGLFPSEGLGFSSGAKIGFGPPSFKQAAMSVPDEGRVHIEMIYP
ncbi:MAG: DUF2141 domain-containing protein [Candidatus Thiodiazotropha lotti]|nr:DUF2141 domain-containing protein [Candidatus Thiodiazotropha lotti]